MSSERVYDLCIIGAGMFGSAAARHASFDSNLNICLVGPNEPTVENISEREIFGAHYDEGRLVRNLDDHPARIILTQNSVKRFKELEKLSGVSFYHPVGCLLIGQKGGKFLKSVTQAAQKTKTSLTEISGKDKLQERYPFLTLKEDETVLLDDDGAGHISPRNLVFAQKKVAEQQGCVVIDSVVDEIKTSPDGIHEVHTETKGSVKANHVLICTGTFTDLKIRSSLKPLALVRRIEVAVLLNVSEEEAQRLRSMPAIVRRREEASVEIGAYILPPIKYPDGKYYLKYGSSAEDNEVINNLREMREWYLSGANETLIDTHLKFVTELLPGLKIIGMKTLSCVLCYNSTGLPYIDHVSPTVTVATVGNGVGARSSDEIGRIAANLSTKGTWNSTLDQDQFRAIFQ